MKTAAQAVPNGRPYDLEADSGNGRRVLEVKVASGGNEFKVVIDESGTNVVSQTQQSKPGDDVAKVEGAKIDAGRALQTAADREKNATLDEMEIDTYNGAVVWKVELVRPDGSDVEIAVDAQNGNII